MSRKTTLAAGVALCLALNASGATAAPLEGEGAPVACVAKANSELSYLERAVVEAFESPGATRKAMALVGLHESSDPAALVAVAQRILCD